MRPRLIVFLQVATLLVFSSCAGSRHYHALDSAVANGAPRYLELRHSVQVATLHFPAGTYTLEAADDAGWFYRAPQPIREGSSSGPVLHNGGIYLRNTQPARLRGYVDWYGGIVHVGDLTRADYLLDD